jgi:hypothetical protein
MSHSIVLWAGAVWALGAETVLVMAVALGLCSAAAVALCQLAPLAHPLSPVDTQAVQPDRRQSAASLSRLWPRWLRPREARTGDDPAAQASLVDAPAELERAPVIGYTTFSVQAGKESDEDLARQAEVVARACGQRGLTLLEMVGDPHQGRQLFRPRLIDAPPGLDYALKRIAAGDAQGLVVPGLRRLARSAAELGPIVEWFIRRRVQLVAVAQGFDTGEPAGQVAARIIVEVSRWERERLWEPTREGQSPSPGSTASAVSDDEPVLIDSNQGGAS